MRTGNAERPPRARFLFGNFEMARRYVFAAPILVLLHGAGQAAEELIELPQDDAQ